MIAGILAGLKSWKAVAIGLAALAIVAAVAAGALHLRSLEQRLAAAEAGQARAELAARSNAVALEETRARWSALVEAQRLAVERLAALQARQEEAGAELARLSTIFARHDLGHLAHEKPALVERRVNRGSARALCLLERATGAERRCDDAAAPGAGADRAAGTRSRQPPPGPLGR